MKTFEEFKKKVFEAIENSHIEPAEVIEKDSSITFSVENQEETVVRLKNLTARLEAEEIRFKSSVSLPSQIGTVNISVFNS